MLLFYTERTLIQATQEEEKPACDWISKRVSLGKFEKQAAGLSI